MSSVSIEVEVASAVPADKVFKVLSDFDNIAPKVDPQAFKSIEKIQGDGGVGTIRLFTFGDGVPYTSGKNKVDALDVNNLTYSHTFYEGDVLCGILESVNHHIKITPSADGGSLFKQKVVYNCKGAEKPSEESLNAEKEQYLKTLKAIEAYGIANAANY